MSSQFMSSWLTSLKIRAVLAAAIVAIATLPLGALGAAAASRHKHATAVTHGHAAPVHRLAGRNGPIGSYAVGAPIKPVYVFIPGRGIAGESCNMPTSTCPDTERDTQ